MSLAIVPTPEEIAASAQRNCEHEDTEPLPDGHASRCLACGMEFLLCSGCSESGPGFAIYHAAPVCRTNAEERAVAARAVRQAAALRTFRRAMRRHEKRARREVLGLANTIRIARMSPRLAADFAGRAELLRGDRRNGNVRFLCERAAEAVAKLRASRAP